MVGGIITRVPNPSTDRQTETDIMVIIINANQLGAWWRRHCHNNEVWPPWDCVTCGVGRGLPLYFTLRRVGPNLAS